MKKSIRSFLSCIACFVTIFASAQAKKGKKKTKTISESHILVASDVASAAEAISSNGIKTDTLKLKSGKPYVLLIDIAPGMNNVTVAGDDQEKNELIRNFGKNTFNIIQLYTYTYIVAANGQYLNLTGEGNSYQAIVYWSGNIADDIVIQEGKVNATEFVALQRGEQKESSYAKNSKEYKKEVMSLQNKNNFTAESQKVMEAYLRLHSTPEICFIEDSQLFNKNQDKVKTINVYIKNGTEKKEKYQTIELNKQGFPIMITYFRDKASGVTKFEYQNAILTSIKTQDNTTHFNYNGDKMIATTDLGGAIDTEVLQVKNEQLLPKSYTIMKDNGSDNMNSFSETKLEGGCRKKYIDNILWSVNCNNGPNKFPFTHTYTSYQDGKVLQKKKYVIEKKTENIYVSSYQDSSGNPNPEREFYVLNDRNLLETCRFTKKQKIKTILLEYTYYE
ncbi:hypothetical protein [Elizabethkingia meningoseptica]|uniref:hypothetical protein n=1 Tax=Elizabethkingia meningoseptica TaxID=238 RepID=UPI0038924AAE